MKLEIFKFKKVTSTNDTAMSLIKKERKLMLIFLSRAIKYKRKCGMS